LGVFVTGGTGCIGQRLTRALVARGHQVRVLARTESVGRVTPGATAIVGNALDASAFAGALTSADTLVHLVGTPLRRRQRRSSDGRPHANELSDWDWLRLIK
jgi:dihydroflavonol-4-reductase